jgi:hypothetical protein
VAGLRQNLPNGTETHTDKLHGARAQEHTSVEVSPSNMMQRTLFDETGEGYYVRQIDSKNTYDFLLNIHYAKRIPSISYAYGLFSSDELAGVITYGIPASPSLCKGVAGERWRKDVIELNRLCLKHNRPNEASRLVGASLRLLPKPKIVVSYADTAQEHTGFVYQATNFLYTGITVKRTEWTVRGLEHLHTKAISNMAGGKGLDAIKEIYGDRFYYRDRSQKHRYVFIVGDKKQKKEILADIKYPVLPYPKETSL